MKSMSAHRQHTELTSISPSSSTCRCSHHLLRALRSERGEGGGSLVFFFQAEDGIRDLIVTGVQTCALPIFRRSRDSLLYVERSSLGSGTFEQRTTVLLDPADGSVRQVDQVTTQQGQKAETHLSYAGGRVKGQSAAPQQDGSIKRYDIDTVLPPGTVDENAVPFVVPALPLAAGKAFTLSFFTPSENAQ